jgi:oxygen-independent coproporphyrinogen III oxidase
VNTISLPFEAPILTPNIVSKDAAFHSKETTVGSYFISNYPPFSTWTPDAIPDFLHALTQPASPGPLGLYVHLPFCRQRCHYCYFRVYPRKTAEDVDRYIDAVLSEHELYSRTPAFHQRPVQSVYFGGGSPTYLSVEQIQRLVGGLQERRPWDAVEECTYECEPGSVTPEKLKLLKQLGVTRVSMGFQSLDNELLRRSGRDVKAEDCVRAFLQAREAGFDEINVDLLAGLPGETESTWRRSVDQVLELTPESVTVYQLELSYNSSLYSGMKAGREMTLPGWSRKRQWAREAFRLCEEAGYVLATGYIAVRHPLWWRSVFTIDHFWHGADLLALGESSFGYLQGVHYQNVDHFGDYAAALSRGELPLRRALKLNPEEQLRRELILQLKTGSLEAGYFRTKFGVELSNQYAQALEWLGERGLLEREGDAFRLTREGLLQVDDLLLMFYLPEHRGVRYT